MAKDCKTVLVARFSALGDVAMTVPVVYSACMAYPDVTFVMITQMVASSLFINCPANLKVVGVDVKVKYKGPRGMWRLMDDLRKDYAFDCFIDLHDVIRTRIIGLYCRLHGIAVSRIDKGRKDKRALTRESDKQMRPLISTRQRYFDAFQRAGFSFGELFTSIYPIGVDAAIYSEITAPKPEGTKWVAIAPFAKHKGKIYPPGLMKLVVDELVKRSGMHIFLFGGGGYERTVLEEWESEYPDRVTSLAGKRYGFAKELALLSHCDVMLSMDSANMHLSSLVGLTVVSVWGATHPYCGFTGWHQDVANEVQIPLECRPCSVFGNKPCLRGDYACLRGIDYHTIIKHLDQVINRQ